jgi:hypothetical protein
MSQKFDAATGGIVTADAKCTAPLSLSRAADDAFAKELPCVAFLRGRSVGPEFRAAPASRAACVTAIGAVGKCRGYEKIAIARHGA